MSTTYIHCLNIDISICLCIICINIKFVYERHFLSNSEIKESEDKELVK